MLTAQVVALVVLSASWLLAIVLWLRVAAVVVHLHTHTSSTVPPGTDNALTNAYEADCLKRALTVSRGSLLENWRLITVNEMRQKLYGLPPTQGTQDMQDKTFREIQLSLPWTTHYSKDFRSSPLTHKDFAHALLHVHKAGGKLAAIVNDAEHGGVDWFNEKTADYLADLVICAMRMANTKPDGMIDLHTAVLRRIHNKNQPQKVEPVTSSGGGAAGIYWPRTNTEQQFDKAWTGRGEDCRNGHKPTEKKQPDGYYHCRKCDKVLQHNDGIHVDDPRNDPRLTDQRKRYYVQRVYEGETGAITTWVQEHPAYPGGYCLVESLQIATAFEAGEPLLAKLGLEKAFAVHAATITLDREQAAKTNRDV